MMMKIKAVQDSVVLVMDKQPKKTEGGIELPFEVKPQGGFVTGKVVSIGPGVEIFDRTDNQVSGHKRSDMSFISVGDRVAVSYYAASQETTVVDGENIAILHGYQILAKIEE
jgi:co-chaperonin GroES (HSP10)